MDNRLSYKQFLKFSIIEAIMNNDDTDLEDLILKLLVECNNTLGAEKGGKHES